MLASIRPRVSPLVFCLALTLGHALWAEETESGADVAELLRKARAGEVEAQLEVTEHFLMNATADTDDSPARDFKQVEQWLHAAALKGSAPAARLLGELLYHDYPGVPVNRVRAMAAFQKAAQGGDVRAMLMLAGVLTSGAEGVQADLAKAEAWINKAAAAAPEGSPEWDQASRMRQQLADWREAAAESEELAKQAESTDPEVRFQLGQRLLTEAGSDKDQQAAAVAHLRFAAEAGHAAAQDAYGTVLERSDRAAGFAWRLKAAEAGLASAQGYAALVLLRGSGPIPADPARGLDLAVRAQLQGDQLLPKTLNGSGYFPGLSSSEAQNLAFSPAPADRTRLLEAAARGEPEAQRWLARGPKPETGAVTRWLAAAAKQEHPGAQFSLGLAYFNGNEVPRNRTQATAWRSRAALLGYPEAQMSLAQNLLEGSGVPANPALARYWFEQVAASPAFIEGHRQIAREKAAAITVAALPPAAALEQTKNLALTARLPDPTEMVAATASQAAPTRPLAELRAAADQGDVAAMYELGRAELDRRQDESNRGSGVVTVDPQRDAYDFRWIMAAARAGHPDAQFLAATHWLSAETDAAKKAWLEKASAQGHAAAKQRLDADTKAAAVAATQAAEAAKKAASDRELAANGDADAALRLFRARVKEIATTIVADFVAEQKGQPKSGKNYKQGYLDADMIKWGDLLTQRLHPDGLVLLHDYLRDDRPDFAYRALLLRERIAKIDLRLQLPDTGGGSNSRAGFEKALAYMREKLTAQQRPQIEKLVTEQFGGPKVDNIIGVNFELGVCGFPKDEGLALAHYRRAAEAGFAEGQSNLGRCYQLGLGVAKDDDQARAWYVKAAAQGSTYAQQRLKDLDTYGRMARIKTLSAEERAKLSEDEWIKAETYTLNAEQRDRLFSKDPAMALQFGLNYRDGANGFVQDSGRAFVWFTEAAEKGSPSALTELGTLHFKGRGRPVDKKVAFSYYLRAAERGDAVGQLNAGFCYLQGEGVDPDPLAAYDWLVKSAAQGQANAQTLVANLKQDAGLQLLLAQRGEAQALDQAKQGAANAVASAPAWDPIKDNPILQLGALATKALQGDKEAAAALNAQQQNLKSQRDLINGPAPTAAATSQSPAALKKLHDQAYVAFLNRETEGAIHLWEQAAALGHVESALRLSSLYQANERGIPRDVSKARQWLERAAASGNEDAVAELRGFEEEMAGGRWEYELGLLAYDDGAGPKAVALFEKAAALGWTEAMLSLGRMYRGGDLVTRDEAKSRAWFQQAADAKSAEGMLNLAYCHRDGVGGTPDLALARKWFEQAAQAKDDEKTVQLAREGLVSIEGNTADSANTLGISAFVAKDYVKAMDWFKKGSALGSDLATYNVADMYANGDGVKADPSEALRWFEKSAAQGNKVAKGRARELRATLKLTSNPELDEKPQSVEDAILANIAGPTTPPAPPPPPLTPAQQALRDKALSATATSQDWLNLALALCPPPAKNPQRDGLKQAFPWFKKAAEAGLEPAQYFVALALRDGFPGTPPDESAAAQLLERLAGPSGPRPVRLQFAQGVEAGLIGLRRDRDRAGQIYAQLAAEKFAPAVAEWERFQRETKVNPPPAPAGETAASRLTAAVAGDADAAVRHYLANNYALHPTAATETALGKALAAGAAAGNLSARAVMAWLWIDNRIGDEQVPEQIAQLRAAAEAGVNEARYRYGLCLWDGVGSIDAPGQMLLPADRAAAVKWFTAAAMRGHPLAHEIVGRAYAHGVGVARNEVVGHRHFRAAAALGVAGAHGQVAQSALRQIEVIRARAMSEGRLPHADEQPWIDALTNEAVRYFEFGVKSGDTDAMVAYARLLDASMDRSRARGLLESAAKLGSAAALGELAGAYATGDRYGLARDIVKSRETLATLAALGDSGAAQRMGELYQGQDGHPRDPLLAYQNLALAVDLGANAVPARDAAAKLLSTADRAKADQTLEQMRVMLVAKGVRPVEPRPAPAPKN